MKEERAESVETVEATDRQSLSDRLRVAREYVGLKQDEVARHLEIPRTALSNIESGQRKVDALELSRLAKLYQRPVTWFTSEEVAGDVFPEEVAHLARAAAKLSSQDRQELSRFADFLKSRARAKESDNGR